MGVGLLAARRCENVAVQSSHPLVQSAFPCNGQTFASSLPNIFSANARVVE
jgi:hypothetical protein